MGRITFTKPQLSKSPKQTVTTTPKPLAPGVTRAPNGNYGVAPTERPSNPDVVIRKPVVDRIPTQNVQPKQPGGAVGGLLAGGVGALLAGGSVKGNPGKMPTAKRIGKVR